MSIDIERFQRAIDYEMYRLDKRQKQLAFFMHLLLIIQFIILFFLSSLVFESFQ